MYKRNPSWEGQTSDPQMASGPRLGRVHDRVLHILAEVDAGAAADRALANAFRRARDLGSHERAQVKQEVYGLLRRRRLAQDKLQRGLAALKKSPDLFDPPIWLRFELLVHLLLEGVPLPELETRDRYAARRVPQLLERIEKGRLPASKTGAVEQAAIKASMPTWLYRRLIEGLSDVQAEQIGQALLERAPLTLRVDNYRFDRESFLQSLSEQKIVARPTILAPHGVIVETQTDFRDWEVFKDARVEVQDEGSQLLAHALGAQAGERVLDACAGAGGKTLALWSAMEGKGQLVAVEPNRKKFDALKRRLKPIDNHTIELQNQSLENVAGSMRGTFDRVLVDAPCTGTGTLRRHPDLKWRLDEASIKTEVDRQVRLLGAALPLLRPGGVLLYATCSVLQEENEAVAEHIVKAAPELDPLPLSETWGTALSQTLQATAMARIGPGPAPTGPDGFFVAAFRRRATK